MEGGLCRRGAREQNNVVSALLSQNRTEARPRKDGKGREEN